MTTFNAGGHVLAELSVRHLAGIRAVGAHVLTVQFDVIMTNYKDAPTGTLTNFGGFVELAKGGRLGELRPYGQRRPMRHSSQIGPRQMLQLLLELDRARLDAVEDLRNAGDLVFTFNLTADVQRPDGIDVGEASVQHRVNAGTWSEILGQMGYQETLVIDVPFPVGDGEGPIHDACQHLKGAQALLLAGQYRESVGRCRDVLDALAMAIGEDNSAGARSENMPNDPREASKSQRYANFRRALRFLTHPARHVDEVTSKYEWTRADALCCVAATAAVVRRFLAEG